MGRSIRELRARYPHVGDVIEYRLPPEVAWTRGEVFVTWFGADFAQIELWNGDVVDDRHEWRRA